MVGSLIGLGLSTGGAIAGAIGSAIRGNRMRSMLDKSHKATQNWYDSQLASNYINRTDVQSALTKQRDLLNEQYKRARATNVVAGGSDAQLAMQKALANQSVAESISSIASNAASYKEGLEQGKINEQREYDKQMASLEGQQGHAIANAAGQIVNAGGQVMANSNWDWLMKKKPQGEAKG